MSVQENPAAPGTGFAVGRVVALTFLVLFTNIIRFAAIILIVAVPVIAFFVLGSMFPTADVTAAGSGIQLQFNKPTMLSALFILVGALLAVLGYLLVVSALIHGTLESLAGRPVSIGACLSAGLSALPRVILAGLCLLVAGILIGVMLALFMSIVSSSLVFLVIFNLALSVVLLMVFARLLVFIPAIMVERAGPMDSFGRSQALTREHRWGIFAILLMITVVNWIVPFASAAMSAISPVAGDVLNIAFGVFFFALVSVLIGVTYHVLRAGKEGAPVGEVAKVFD